MNKRFTLTFFALLVSWASFATISGSSTICISIPETYTDSGPGTGVWLSSNPAIANISSVSGATATVTGVSSGVATLSYMVGSTVSTYLVTVSNAPVPIVGGGVTICGGTSVTLTDATLGGNWTSSPATVGVVSYWGGVFTGFSGPGATGGVATITYAVGSCSVTTTVTVNTTPIDSIMGASVVCTGSSTTLTNTVPGGTWSSSAPGIATINSSTGVATGIAVGAATITYTTTGVCGPIAEYWNLTVTNTSTPPVLNPILPVGIGGTSIMTTSVAGGAWSSANPAVATVSSAGSWSGLITGVAIGTATISYGIPGCAGPTVYATQVVTVTGTSSGISGHVVFSGTQSARVWLIHYDSFTQMLTAIDSTVVTGTDSAYYQFTGLLSDSFRVKAALTGSTTGFVPTYHTSSYYWNTASVINHALGTWDSNKSINMIAGMPVSGPGFIGGSVITGANKGTTDGAAVPGMNVYLLNAATHAVIKHTITDAAGEYSFSNLPIGIYDIFPEELSYATTPYVSVTLTTAAPSMSTAKFMQRTISKKITPIGTVAVNELDGASTSISEFPNPTSGKLNINWNAASSEAASLIITDVTGREVLVKSFSMTRGDGAEAIDLSSLANGMYFISVKAASATYINKIEVKH